MYSSHSGLSYQEHKAEGLKTHNSISFHEGLGGMRARTLFEADSYPTSGTRASPDDMAMQLVMGERHGGNRIRYL